MNPINNKESVAYQNAERRVSELHGFYGNLLSYCVVIPMLALINIYTLPQYLWFWWPMLGWGIGVASHAVKTFGLNGNWKEKQIRKYMEKHGQQ